MERTTLFYMANLGSEVQRIFSLRKIGFLVESEDAYKRALDIIGKVEMSNEFPHRVTEIELLKSYLTYSIKHSDQVRVEKEWQEYFMPFMLRQLSLSKII